MAIKNENIVGRSDVYHVKPNAIKITDEWNPRISFGDQDDIDLKNSIIENGVRVPIRVKKTKDGEIVLVDGERRLRAVYLAIDEGNEIEGIPAIFERRGISDAEALIDALVANTGKPLNPIEEASAFNRLRNWGLSIRKIAEKIGKSFQFVQNRLKLVDASEDVKQKVVNKEINIGDAVNIVDESDGNIAAQNQIASRSSNGAGKNRRKFKKIKHDDVVNEIIENSAISENDEEAIRSVLSKYNIRIEDNS